MLPNSWPIETRAVMYGTNADRVILGMEDARRSLSDWPPKFLEALAMVEVAHAELTALMHDLRGEANDA